MGVHANIRGANYMPASILRRDEIYHNYTSLLAAAQYGAFRGADVLHEYDFFENNGCTDLRIAMSPMMWFLDRDRWEINFRILATQAAARGIRIMPFCSDGVRGGFSANPEKHPWFDWTGSNPTFSPAASDNRHLFDPGDPMGEPPVPPGLLYEHIEADQAAWDLAEHPNLGLRFGGWIDFPGGEWICAHDHPTDSTVPYVDQENQLWWAVVEGWINHIVSICNELGTDLILDLFNEPSITWEIAVLSFHAEDPDNPGQPLRPELNARYGSQIPTDPTAARAVAKARCEQYMARIAHFAATNHPTVPTTFGHAQLIDIEGQFLAGINTTFYSFHTYGYGFSQQATMATAKLYADTTGKDVVVSEFHRTDAGDAQYAGFTHEIVKNNLGGYCWGPIQSPGFGIDIFQLGITEWGPSNPPMQDTWPLTGFIRFYREVVGAGAEGIEEWLRRPDMMEHVRNWFSNAPVLAEEAVVYSIRKVTGEDRTFEIFNKKTGEALEDDADLRVTWRWVVADDGQYNYNPGTNQIGLSGPDSRAFPGLGVTIEVPPERFRKVQGTARFQVPIDVDGIRLGERLNLFAEFGQMTYQVDDHDGMRLIAVEGTAFALADLIGEIPNFTARPRSGFPGLEVQYQDLTDEQKPLRAEPNPGIRLVRAGDGKPAQLLRNDTDEPVELSGWNWYKWHDVSVPQTYEFSEFNESWDPELYQAELDSMKEEGCNFLVWSIFFGGPFTNRGVTGGFEREGLDGAYLDKVASFCRMLKEREIYTYLRLDGIPFSEYYWGEYNPAFPSPNIGNANSVLLSRGYLDIKVRYVRDFFTELTKRDVDFSMFVCVQLENEPTMNTTQAPFRPEDENSGLVVPAEELSSGTEGHISTRDGRTKMLLECTKAYARECKLALQEVGLELPIAVAPLGYYEGTLTQPQGWAGGDLQAGIDFFWYTAYLFPEFDVIGWHFYPDGPNTDGSVPVDWDEAAITHDLPRMDVETQLRLCTEYGTRLLTYPTWGTAVPPHEDPETALNRLVADVKDSWVVQGWATFHFGGLEHLSDPPQSLDFRLFEDDSRAIPVWQKDALNRLAVAAVWDWRFSGGTPTTSKLRHPKVVYPTAGKFPAAVTITRAGGEQRTVRYDRYIGVEQESLKVRIANALRELASAGPWYPVDYGGASKDVAVLVEESVRPSAVETNDTREEFIDAGSRSYTRGHDEWIWNMVVRFDREVTSEYFNRILARNPPLFPGAIVRLEAIDNEHPPRQEATNGSRFDYTLNVLVTQ